MNFLKSIFLIAILGYTTLAFTACTNQNDEETDAMYIFNPVQNATDNSDAEISMDKEDEEEDNDTNP